MDGDEAGVGDSGGDDAQVAIGRLVFVEAFKADAGAVIDQRGCDGVFRVADLEVSCSGVDGGGDEEGGAGGEDETARETGPARRARIAIGRPDGGDEKDGHGCFNCLEHAPGILQEGHLRERVPDWPRDGKEKKQDDDGDGGEGNPHFAWFWKGAAEIADEDGDESDGDHGDGDPGDLAQDNVVHGEDRVGVVREEPAVLKVVAGILSGLTDIDPMALEGGWNPVDGGETEAERGGDGGAKYWGPGFVDDGPEERGAGEQVAGDDSEWEIGEPCAGKGDGERDG